MFHRLHVLVDNIICVWKVKLVIINVTNCEYKRINTLLNSKQHSHAHYSPVISSNSVLSQTEFTLNSEKSVPTNTTTMASP